MRAVLTRFLPQTLALSVRENSRRFSAILPGARCAGVDYPRVATGEQDFVLFWRLLPWDHAPGTLFLEETGGCVARFDGSPYRPADQSPGLLAARNREIWRMFQSSVSSLPYPSTGWSSSIAFSAVQIQAWVLVTTGLPNSCSSCSMMGVMRHLLQGM